MFLLPQKLTKFLFGGLDFLDACVSRFFHPTKWLRNFAGAPVSGMLEYLVPPARSRYCASPEASILIKAKAKPEHPPTRKRRQLSTKNYELMHRERQRAESHRDDSLDSFDSHETA